MNVKNNLWNLHHTVPIISIRTHANLIVKIMKNLISLIFGTLHLVNLNV